MKPDLSRKVWLSIAELVEYLDFPTANAAHHWLLRTEGRVPKGHVGRKIVVSRRDVDAEVQRDRDGRPALKRVG